ncbi:MAG TPA: pilus assembly protein TadG-related protein [Sphingomicrobium sp.]|nr:pilus assembly protein TadG-related protein [Sphingomicrobium sp.]
MIGFLRKLWNDRRGNVLIIVGAALPLIVGAAGLATDTVQWTLTKRELQRAADSAALAGVFGRLAGQTVTTDDCSKSTPIAHDETTGLVTSKIGTVTCTATVDGWGTSTNKSVAVSMSTTQTLPFSSLFLKTTPTLTATATAAYVLYGKYCVISLDNTVDTGIQMSGTPTVNLGCGMKTDAKGSSAFDCTGAAKVTASPIAAVGAITACPSLGSGTTYQPYAPPQTDPFLSVNAPSVPNSCNKDVFPNGTKTTSVSVTGTTTGWANNTPTTVCYTDFTVGSGQTFTGSDLLVIIDKSKNGNSNGNFTINSGGTVNCIRCTFVLTSDSTSLTAPIGTVSMDASATLDITAPTVGTLYPNIAIYQDRRATCNNYCNTINGNSNSTLQGAVYLPNEGVQMDGTAGMNSNCLQLVAWQVKFSGTANITNSCSDGSTGHTFDGYMVRLVA